jgi:hypothetical protein
VTRHDEPGTGNGRSAPPLRTWRPMAAWTAGILLALGLAWFVGAVVVPVMEVRKVVGEYCKQTRWVGKRWPPWPAHEENAIKGLGGPDAAVRKLALYIRFPQWVAPNQFLEEENHGVPALLKYCEEVAAADGNEAVRQAAASLRTKIGAAQGWRE